ncbi:hypothetical protein SAMN05428997_1594 [Bosea sp. CRIB-10]|jgi:hypothetical protein|uniref:hypothetical protein n=1 Tax=Bosea sp. CRIB-10 TaxID=378404 RepID=UPI00086992FF|nr:hypothetical protein [Bosea sp. CRIB-10]ODT25832.1 MAG: hypothetical protein ABS54_08140 [Hyphomicrobium sp. SCN 65-11]SFD78437.1 hypothetical protein SAMN05428997_1594 [Bosea sp. CRIB-10]
MKIDSKQAFIDWRAETQQNLEPFLSFIGWTWSELLLADRAEWYHLGLDFKVYWERMIAGPIDTIVRSDSATLKAAAEAELLKMRPIFIAFRRAGRLRKQLLALELQP